MEIPILKMWKKYYLEDRNEGLGSSYERIILNLKLEEIAKIFSVNSALEVPIFGFTGLSGINSMWLAKKKINVHLIDNDKGRVELIKKVWNEVKLDVNLIYQQKFEKFPLKSKSIDFAWNFSAIWFIDDIDEFLRELTRVTSKVIMICVPNRSGFGYLYQKYNSGVDLKKFLNEEFIIPKNIIKSMSRNGWKLLDKNYIDCPPWPDIGMAREDFLKKCKLGFLMRKDTSQIPFYSIMDYYSEKNRSFKEEMLKFIWFEKMAPNFIKFFWAHHKYLLFTDN